MIVQGLDFFGNIVSLDKAKVDFIKLMLLIYSGEVFGFRKYGHDYLDIYDDGSIHAAIDKANDVLVGNKVEVAQIDRANPGVIKIKLEGNAEPIEVAING